jgi:hypothetical protein
MIQIKLKEHSFFFNYFFILMCLFGVPFEFSWQCKRCKTWEWGSVYRLVKSTYFEEIKSKCIKHKEWDQ